MFKFLIYLFIIYVLYRLVFGRMVKTKVYKFDTHHHNHNNTASAKEEGSVTVNPKIKQEKTGGNTQNIGEYVDYEEVK